MGFDFVGVTHVLDHASTNHDVEVMARYDSAQRALSFRQKNRKTLPGTVNQRTDRETSTNTATEAD
jgi:hypothetical protein